MKPSKSITPTSLVLRGKPAQVRAMMNSLIERHGENATLPEVYKNTIDDLKHPRKDGHA